MTQRRLSALGLVTALLLTLGGSCGGGGGGSGGAPGGGGAPGVSASQVCSGNCAAKRTARTAAAE